MFFLLKSIEEMFKEKIMQKCKQVIYMWNLTVTVILLFVYILLLWKYSFHVSMRPMLVCLPAHLNINQITCMKQGNNDVKMSMPELFLSNL